MNCMLSPCFFRLYTYHIEHVVYMSCAAYTHGEDANKCWDLERLESVRRKEPRPLTHCSKPLQKNPNNQQQLPCYVNPALESTSPQIPLILELLPAVQWTGLRAAAVQGQLQPWLLHFLKISSYDCSSVMIAAPCSDDLPSTNRV